MKQVIMILLCYVSIDSFAQETKEIFSSDLMIKAFTINSPALWDKAIDDLESDLDSINDQDLTHLALSYAYYGLAGTCIGANKKTKGNEAAEKGLMYAKKLIKHPNYSSEAHALIAGLYGIKIAFSPMKGMFLGPKSDKHCNKAIDLNDQNGFAYLQRGSSLFNTPKMFGGDIKESIEAFNKAVNLLSSDSDKNEVWKLEAMTWLGQAYAKTGQKQKAKKTYTDILVIAPNFSWVKDILIPAL